MLIADMKLLFFIVYSIEKVFYVREFGDGLLEVLQETLVENFRVILIILLKDWFDFIEY